MTTLTHTTARRAVPARSSASTAARRQSVALLGQLVAGAGNLVVSVLLARLLVPGEYAELTAFLAGYVLMHTVASSVTAATALDPSLHGRLRDRAALAGFAVTVVGVALTPVLSSALHLGPSLVLLLAWSGPSATLLALSRGRLYGLGRAGGTALTLATEPVARGVVGLALVPALGPTGAAAGVVAAGYASLLAASLAGRRARPGDLSRAPGRTSVAVTLTFLLVAVVAAQDVVVANRLLSGDEAGFVAAVATIGGAAYFATATIPMVLMPSGDDAGRGSLGVALGAAAAVSLALVAAVAALPASVYAAVLGDEYAGVGPYAVGYVAAMAALGIAKVFTARLCMTGRSAVAAALAALAVAGQLVLLLRAEDAADVVRATGAAAAFFLVATALATGLLRSPVRDGTLGGSAVAEPVVPTPVAPAEPGPSRPVRDRRAPRPGLGAMLRDAWPLLLALVVGTALRLMVTRSIWLDEAISIRQVQQPLGQMLVDLRENDVHPPGFNLVLWAVVQATGSTSELVVRLPSLAAGIGLIAVFWAMGRDLWDRRTGVVAALFVAVAPVAVWYAQEARMYSLWMLATTVALWMQVRILRDTREGGRGRWTDWTLFAVSSTALVYLQWFAVLPVLVQHLIFLGCLFRRDLRRLAPRWFVAVATSLAMFAPLVPFLLGQARSVISASGTTTPGQTGVSASDAVGDSPDVYAVLANTIWSLWGYHADDLMVQASALWPVVLLVCLAALGRGRSIPVGVLAAVAVLPMVALFAIGFERRQLFELRYFTTTVPVLLLLVSRLVATWARGPVSRVVLPGVVLASLVAGLADQQVNQSNPRTYDFRGAVSWVERTAEPDDVMLYAPAFLEDELAYYSAGIPAEPVSRLDPERPGLGLPASTGPGDSVFVFASFLDEAGTSAQVGEALARLEQAGWQRAETFKVANVTVWQFTQQQEVAQ